jgi:hypothetical protein
MSAMHFTLRAMTLLLLGGGAISLAAPPDAPSSGRPEAAHSPSSADSGAAGQPPHDGKSGAERKKIPAGQSGERDSHARDRGTQGGSDTRGAQGQGGATTGSTGQGGLPGCGASSGSGGTADQR